MGLPVHERAPGPIPAPHHAASDLARRNFTVAAPNQLWVADITFIPTNAGFLYLVVVIDACSCRVIGWSFATDLKVRLVLNALDMALEQRKPDDVIHHSDKGSQYTSIAFGARCAEAGVRPSTGSVGDVYDNAMSESFFATLECELIDRRRFQFQTEARMAVSHSIEGFYNPTRRHSVLGCLLPINYESAYAQVTVRKLPPSPSTKTGQLQHRISGDPPLEPARRHRILHHKRLPSRPIAG